MRRPSRRDRELEAALRGLGPVLDTVRVSDPAPELVERTLRAARAELVRPAPAPRTLPEGFGRELARLLGLAVAPGALAVLWNALVFLALPPLLADWLPAPLASALLALYVFGALGTLAMVYGLLPFVAHRRALMRHPEATRCPT